MVDMEELKVQVRRPSRSLDSVIADSSVGFGPPVIQDP